MDLVSLSVSLGALIICLSTAARCSAAEKSNCPCGEIPHVPKTKPPPETCSDTFRYTCIEDYVRKAGTSNLIRCTQKNDSKQWTEASLKCIPDPRKTTTRPPDSTVKAFSISPLPTQTGSRAEATRPGVQGDNSQGFVGGTQATAQTTATSSKNKTVEPHLTAAVVACVSVALVCAFAIGGICYTRRSRHNGPPVSQQERICINRVPSEQVS